MCVARFKFPWSWDHSLASATVVSLLVHCIFLSEEKLLALGKKKVITVAFFSCAFLFPLFRHRRAIQKSRGSKVRRAEGTMESEPGAPASTANSTGTTTASSTTSSNTTATSSSSTSNTAAATTSTTSTSSSNSSSNNSSGSSSTTTGRQPVPQISVYSGIPDRQTVQVGSLVLRRNCWQLDIKFGYCVCDTCRYTQTSCTHKCKILLCSTALCWCI